MPCDPILLTQIRGRLELHELLGNEPWADIYRRMLATLAGGRASMHSLPMSENADPREIMERAVQSDAEAAKQFPEAAKRFLDEARGPKFLPVQESWTQGRHVGGTITFEWLRGDPMPPDATKLQELHMGDTITDGELPQIGKARFRVNTFSTSIDNDRGMWRAEAGIEVL